MTKKKQSTKRRRKNRGKYTPLIWIVTAALIAFFVSYSRILMNGEFGKGAANTNQKPLIQLPEPTQKKQLFELTNTVSQLTQSQQISVYIYLALVTDNKIKLVPKLFDLPPSQSVLKDTLTILMNYRGDAEFQNLIPLNTHIKRLWVKERVAHIDFNSAFVNNSYGTIGYQTQLYQIVYTATQFASVDAVHFYVEGKSLEYLGGDGLMVHNPVFPYSSLPEFYY